MPDYFSFRRFIFDLGFHGCDFRGEFREELAGYGIAVVGGFEGEDADVAGVRGGDVAD